MEKPTKVYEIVPYFEQLIAEQSEVIAKLEARIANLEAKNNPSGVTPVNKPTLKK